ncbi:MAG: S9 family peptidase [Bacteroidales bacterium]|nr:S9 family peptidase [Bacteroidales bacterium]
MKKSLIYCFLPLLLACNSRHLDYPFSKKADTVDVYYGKEVADPYRWLEDPLLPETREWIQAQNKLTLGYLSRIPFRDSLKARLTEVWNYERCETPEKKGGKYYFRKNDGLQNQSVLYVMDTIGAEPRVVLDPNLFSQDGTVALSGYAISPDGKYLSYALSRGGSDWNEIFVRDLTTGQDLADHLEQVKFSGISWYRKGFYYSRYPGPADRQQLTSRNRNHRVYYHTLKRPQETDILVFEDTEHPDRNFIADVTFDERFLIIYESESTYGTKIYIKNLQTPGKRFIQYNDSFDYETTVIGNTGNELFLLTNENAPKNKLIKLVYIPGSNTLQEDDLIAEDYHVLQQAVLAGDKIIAQYLVDVHSVIKVMDRQGKFLYEMKLPEYVSVSTMNGNEGDNELFYSLASYTVPSTIYCYHTEKNLSRAIFQPMVDFNPVDYTTRLEFCISKDGTKIPVYIVHHKDVRRNSKNPTCLYGYGGFGVSLLPRFSASHIVWLENGGIIVNANLRGGGEYGEEWHKAGTKHNKQNVFDDFIAVAEYLIQNKYTSPHLLAIEGHSNGGLLVGAVVNQRPELFGVALPGVGVMDMLRYHKFTIGWAWESDYGSVDDSVGFNYLYAYSPLHNIRENVKYPAIMATTADHDDRVVPAHSFKYIATLQEKYKGPNPVLIRIQTKAGHGAGKPTRLLIDEQADIWAFAFYNLKINPFNN